MNQYSGPWILRPPIQPVKCGLKLKLVLKWKDIYTEIFIYELSLVANPKKTEGIVK